MTSKLICFLIGLLGVVSIVLYWFKQPDDQGFTAPAAIHSIQLVPEGEKQINVPMTRYEWRLLILQSHYEKKEYEQVIRVAPSLITQLKQESPDRREVFAAMIEDSYRRLGHKQKASEIHRQLASSDT
ncbi:MAG: hypothetical protein H6757_06310 [Candidatus Omnitrophica bacterium]|nr:hypothetical protein [Candidatus Omnitrophota bacterium]